MVRFPALEYSLSHPHPKGRIFLAVTLVIFLLTLPVLILVNFVTQGSELVPSLQPQFQNNGTLLEGWWGSTKHLPKFLRPKIPLCQPKDIGRGDSFRLTTSLFDYTVMSVLNAPTSPNATTNAEVPKQIRATYKGENFTSGNCYVNRVRFDYSLFDQTQSLTVGVLCPRFLLKQPVNVSMQTTITFAWELSKDFVGQYYGDGLNLLEDSSQNQQDYRKVVLGVLELLSSDSIAVMRRPHLSSPFGSMRIVYDVDRETVGWHDVASTITYTNGTQPDPYTEEARIYTPAIGNLVTAAVDAVHLDLGRRDFKNTFMNDTLFKSLLSPNSPPPGINASDWALGFQTFHFGNITPPYETWAQMLIDGQAPVHVGDLTGFPDDSAMFTTYLCPIYQVKKGGSLLSSIFIGTATMTLSVWGVWMFATAFVAKKIMAPQVQCECKGCLKRRQQMEEEEKKRQTNQAMGGMLSGIFSWGHRKTDPNPKDVEARDSTSGSGVGSSEKVSPSERPVQELHANSKYLSGTSTITVEDKQDLTRR